MSTAKRLVVLIADDHALIREGLVSVLEKGLDAEFLQTEDGDEALQLIQSRKPDVAILDVEMPNMSGYDVAMAVNRLKLPTKLIILTMIKDGQLFRKAMEIGVRGYVLKENTSVEMLQCVKKVLRGDYYLSPAVSGSLLQEQSTERNQRENSDGKLELLTSTERSVLKQVAELKTSQEIADSMFISVKTVQNHRNNICSKLGLQGAHALLRFAVERSDRL